MADLTQVVVVEIDMIDEDENSQRLRFATNSFATRPTDTPANSMISGRLSRGMVIGREIRLTQEGAFGPLIVGSVNDIELTNADGALDYLVTEWFADGRDVRFLVGFMDPETKIVEPFDNFTLVYVGTGGAWSIDRDVLRLGLRDSGISLQVPLQENTYSGGGGSTGTAEMEGKTKPLVFGRIFNGEAQLLDPTNLIYQIHDGQYAVGDITVRDAGASLTQGSDFSTYANLVASTPSAGTFTTDAGGGYIKLGILPFGLVTFSTRDMKVIGTGAYSSSTHSNLVEAIRYMIETFTAVDVAIDASSFVALAGAQDTDFGYFAPAGTAMTVEDLIANLALSIGAVLGQDRSGLYRIFRLDTPSGDPDWDFPARDLVSIVREPPAYRIPWRKWYLQYGHTWRVMLGGDVISSASAATRASLGNAFKRVVSVLSDVATVHHSAATIARDGFFLNPETANVQDEADRLAGFYSLGRAIYRIRVKSAFLKADIGQTCQITYPRFGITGGKLCVIVGLRDDLDASETEMVLFG